MTFALVLRFSQLPPDSSFKYSLERLWLGPFCVISFFLCVLLVAQWQLDMGFCVRYICFQSLTVLLPGCVTLGK